MYNDGRITIIYKNGDLHVQLEVQESITSLERSIPLAKEVFPFITMSRKHSSLMK